MPTFPLLWPEEIAPSSESWVLGGTDRGGGPGITGTEQTVGSPRSPWRAKITFRLSQEKIVRFRGLIFALRGRAGIVRIGPFNLYGQPRSGSSDDGLQALGLVAAMQAGPPFGKAEHGTIASGAVMLARQILITMPRARRPGVGNYVRLGDGLHVITGVWGGWPTFSCEIEPGLRADVPAGWPAIFDRPTCLMKQFTPIDPAGLAVSGETRTTDVTLDLVEAF